MLRSDDDDQDEGHREWNHGLWLGLSAMWSGHRLPDRYSPAMASGTARDVGAFGRLGLLNLVISPAAVQIFEGRHGQFSEQAHCNSRDTREGVPGSAGSSDPGCIMKEFVILNAALTCLTMGLMAWFLNWTG